MNKHIENFLLAVLTIIAFFSGYYVHILNADIQWREFDKNHKYSYERISPDSVNLTVCSTQHIYLKSE
jgi:hypothetical protein